MTAAMTCAYRDVSSWHVKILESWQDYIRYVWPRYDLVMDFRVEFDPQDDGQLTVSFPHRVSL